MKKSPLNLLLIVPALILLTSPARVAAHCEIPCGIYNDSNVVEALQTDWETIAKSRLQILELSKDPVANANQITRWVNNKEAHCQKIQDTVARYFLAQRVKLDEAKSKPESYARKLALCHEVIVTSMKCKQSTDEAPVKKLKTLLAEFEKTFAGK